MPKPAFIVCSESGSLDQTTKRVSIFDVIEEITISSRPPKDQIPCDAQIIHQSLDIRVTAVWRHTPEDEKGASYETRIVFGLPDGTERVVAEGHFREADVTLYRTMVIVKNVTFDAPGLLRVIGHIRKKGTEEWLGEQEYAIQVKVSPTIHSSPQTELTPPDG